MDDPLDKCYRPIKRNIPIIITKLNLTTYTNKRMRCFWYFIFPYMNGIQSSMNSFPYISVFGLYKGKS